MLTICLGSLCPSTPQLYLHPGSSGVCEETIRNLATEILPVQPGDIYCIYNGRRIESNISLTEGLVHVIPRLTGGKGGFGSMLRAIGAQIEKTTNREACRDLSGRRLRDINEEKRLKNWISKKAEREREASERKKRKLEKLRSEPKHEFVDKHYEEERSKLTEEVCSSVERGFQVSASDAGPSKPPAVKPVRKNKAFMLEDEEFSDSSSFSSSEDEAPSVQKQKAGASSSDESSPCKKEKTGERLAGQKRKAEASSSDESSPCKKEKGVEPPSGQNQKAEASSSDESSPCKKEKTVEPEVDEDPISTANSCSSKDSSPSDKLTSNQTENV